MAGRCRRRWRDAARPGRVPAASNQRGRGHRGWGSGSGLTRQGCRASAASPGLGPAPYDDTWAELPAGAGTAFYLSGRTYHAILWTPPQGNAYYILAHHFIAALLNRYAGASVPAAVGHALDEADALFAAYPPDEIGALRGDHWLRQAFLWWAGVLGDYNEGKLGPGHCAD